MEVKAIGIYRAFAFIGHTQSPQQQGLGLL